MESQDYPIRHFEQMARFGAALKALPAQINQHHYHYESFGSWWTILTFKGLRFRVLFDGKESKFSIQCSESQKPSDEWGKDVWSKSASKEDRYTIPEAEIIETVVHFRQ